MSTHRGAQGALFGARRMEMDESIELTVESLCSYLPRYRHVAVAWSGGKDSTTLVTLLIHLIESGRVPRPERLTVLYADTRMELTPLWWSAAEVREELRERGIDVRTVMAPMDRRFLVYILGRGVPPPNNTTLRWCTRQIKLDPMAEELRQIRALDDAKVLVLTGVRQGESAIRDGRIAMSCGRNGAECGQGWYQETLPGDACDTLAPLLHWRVCHVWRWLRDHAPDRGWPTRMLADAYGGDEAEEVNARTGCVGCPLAAQDTALLAVVALPQWAYLAPLLELRPLYREMREPRNRLRQPGGERRADGTLTKNQQRMGPLRLEFRLEALDRILDIQGRINAEADRRGRPHADLLNTEEEGRIRDLIAAGTWPRRWSGDEPSGDELLDAMYADGTTQPLLPMFGGAR